MRIICALFCISYLNATYTRLLYSGQSVVCSTSDIYRKLVRTCSQLYSMYARPQRLSCSFLEGANYEPPDAASISQCLSSLPMRDLIANMSLLTCRLTVNVFAYASAYGLCWSFEKFRPSSSHKRHLRVSLSVILRRDVQS